MGSTTSVLLIAALIAIGATTCENPARAAEADYCPGVAANRIAHAVPPQLESKVAETFGIGVAQVRDGARVRCVRSRLLACWVGANLDCGKADTRRRLSGATAFCRDNPNADAVPMAATGHATVYSWRCVHGQAMAGKVVMPVDAQGFIADNWKTVN